MKSKYRKSRVGLTAPVLLAVLWALIMIAVSAIIRPAHAAILATMPNRAGGAVILTDYQGACDKGAWMVYATSEGGLASTGCWTLMDDKVVYVVRGQVFVQDRTDFKVYRKARQRKEK